MINELESLFFAAIELPPEERHQFLKEQCGDNESLQSELLNLLEQHEAAAGHGFILNRPVVSSDRSLAERDSETAHYAGQIVGQRSERQGFAHSEQVGDRIGRYRLLEKIGEGGMGEVFMAEQVEDVRRRVALKIIKLGMDTRQVIARFEAERQALAMFDHPNIARIIDAGTTSSGRPFFAMELVKGTSLIEFVRNRNLGMRERLELFCQICSAVQHAHQKGIIHRDLKPSNILVTLFDGVPVPKVIDFGIAKALHDRLTEKTLFTRFTAMIGTPQYMSPEQAEMSGLDIDTRSDIYSLGVILYELLTGTTPLDPQLLHELNPMALVETLQKHEVETPSTRVTRLQTGELVYEDVSNLSDIGGQLKGDLDWIVMKALSRDRSLRYSSATEFGADISRYLAGEPVEAVAPSRLYKLQKFYAKHWKIITAVSVSMAVLVLTTIITIITSIQLYDAKNKLTDTLAELTTKNAELQEKEKLIQEAADSKFLKSAVAMAFFKFRETIFIEQTAGENVIPEEFLTDEFLQAIGVDGFDPYGTGFDDLPIQISFAVPDFLMSPKADSELVNLKHRKLVESELKPVLEYLEDEQRISQGPYSELAPVELAEEFAGLELDESRMEQLKQEAAKRRPEFFKILVQMYRQETNNKDHIAQALNLLGAALLESSKTKEQAEPYLREALAITTATDINRVSQELLEMVNR